MTEGVRSVVDAYVALYGRRIAQRGTAFDAPLQSALLALLYLELGLRGRSSDWLPDHLEGIAKTTRPLLIADPVPPPAGEVGGYVWATAYGLLPLLEPPMPQIEIVMSRSEVLRYAGITANAWRALFITTAWPYLNFDLRARAEAELALRVKYVAERLGELDNLAPPQVWQVTPLLVELSRALQAGEIEAAAASALSKAEAAPDGLPTSQLSQLATAAYTVGDRSRAQEVVDFLLRQRYDGATGLLLSDDAGERAEFSPWVPIGLVCGTSSRAPQLTPAEIFGEARGGEISRPA